ncbi:MAG: hypothetical protein U9R08_07205 [Nanoarchaeota archaeon]|nr:hypothetical protein [Nanoarchaeota archaeon]
MSKGQAAVEFAMGLSILMTIFVVFMVVISQRTADQTEENFQYLVETFETFLRSEVDTAISVEDGYERNFTVPYTFSGANYSIETQPDPGARRTFVTLDFEGVDYVYSINIEHDINGDFKKGLNTIKKRDGEVSLV